MRSGRSLPKFSIEVWENKFSKSEENGKPVLDDNNRNQGSVVSGSSHIQKANSMYRSIALAGLGASPVFFKMISSVTKSRGVTDLMQYLNKGESVELETGFGEIALTREEVNALAGEWRDAIEQNEINRLNPTGSSVQVRHGVIGFPSGTNKTTALEITRATLTKEFGAKGLDYLIAGHFNEQGENPHVHFVTRVHLPDGTKLQIDKAKIFDIRETISIEAHSQGINLHHGMAWERGVQSSKVSRNQYEEGLRPERKRLTGGNQKRLKNRIQEVKELLAKASIRTKNMDKIVKKQVDLLERQQGSRNKVELGYHTEIEDGFEIEN